MATILLLRTREMGLIRSKIVFQSHIAAGRRSYNNSAVLRLLLQVRQLLSLSILDFIFPSGRGFLLSTSCNRGGVFLVDMFCRLKFWDWREL